MRDKRIWEALLEIIVQDPDYEWLMIDVTHCKVHPHAAGAVGGNQDISRSKGGLNSKIHVAVDAHGMPVRVLITEATTADCTQASKRIEGIKAEYLLADKAYDTDTMLKDSTDSDINPVIPPKKNRKKKRSYDVDLYKFRHLVENAFLHLKRWRGIATR